MGVVAESPAKVSEKKEVIPIERKSARKRTVSKTFEENTDWE